DVWQTAASFKKGRLGCIVHALAAPAESAAVEKAYFLHSSTLGVRRQRLQRSKLARKIQTLETQWGPVRVKQASGPNEIFRQKYEYEDLARIAKETDQPIQRVTAQLDQINSKS
ncbi:MAG: nickel insertion protein, partial [Pseudomonadota bacterium]